MRKTSLTLLALCSAVLVLVILAGVVLFLAKEHILAWTLESVTGHQVLIEGPVVLDLSMEPSLSVSDMQIGSEKDDGQRLTAHLGR
ncbi:MAG: hypothetical protein JSU90_03410, partial [Nitrospiraceae bacterium]